MAVNQPYKEFRVLELPTTGLSKGDRHYLDVGASKYMTFIVSDGLNLIRESGAEFIEKDTMADFRAITEREIWSIQQGYYKGVKLNGYYAKGDTPSPIDYYISNNPNSDDGGSIIAIGGIKFEHVFLSIDPLYFGAKNDGITDASDKIELCLRKEVQISSDTSKSFLISRSITSSNTLININGLRLKLDHINLGSGSSIRFNDTAVKTGLVNNSTTISELARTITLDNTSNILVGDLLLIKCIPQTSGNIIVGKEYVIMSTGGNFASVGAANNNVGTSFTATANNPDYGTGGSLLILWDYDPRPGSTNVTLGEVHKVNAIDGNVITLDVPFMTQMSSTLNIQYTVYRPKPFYINNLILESNEIGSFAGLGVATKINGIITNSMFNKVSGIVGLSIGNCYNMVVSKTTIKDGYFAGTATGYGIQDNGSTGTLIVDSCRFENNRRGVDFSGGTPNHLSKVANCYIASTSANNLDGSGVGTHGGADLSSFEDNIIVGGIIGVQLRGGRCSVKRNTFIAPSICCVSISFSDTVDIESNKLIKSRDYSNLNTGLFVQTNATTKFTKQKPLKIQYNTISEVRQAIIGFTSNENVNLLGLNLIGNEVTLRSNAGSNNIGYFLNGGTGIVTLRDSIIESNTVKALVGNYKVGHNFKIDSVFNQGDIGYQFESSDLQVWSGTGILSDVNIDVIQKPTKDGFASVSGKVSFTLTGIPSLIVLRNALRAPSVLLDYYSKEGNPIRIDNAGGLYFGYEVGDTYATVFPAGTYTINFNILYPLNVNYKY